MKSSIFRNLAAGLILAIALPSCGGSGSTTLQPPIARATPSANGLTPGAEVAGSVALPSGMALQASALSATDTFGAVPLSASGSFSIGTVDSDPQFVSVAASAGTPLLVGWLGKSEPVINAFTTAEVYLYFAVAGYTLPDTTSRTEVIASIHTLPGLGAVQSAISSALVMSPTMAPASNASVRTAIATLVASLGGSTAAASRLIARGGSLAPLQATRMSLTRDVLGVMPGTSRSGMDIITGDDGYSFKFQNTLRLPGMAFVDEVSHVDAVSGQTVTDHAIDASAPMTVAGSGAIGTFGGSISDYLHGAYALVDALSEEVPTPNLEGAKSTQYRVALIRAGSNAGDYAKLTPLEQSQVTEEYVETIVYEETLPLIAAILVPSAKVAGLQSASVNAAIKDVIGTLASDAGIKTAAESGNPAAVIEKVSADIAGSASLTEKLVEGTLELLGVATGAIPASAVQEISEMLIAPIELVDAGIAIYDVAAIVRDADIADEGDIFTITASNEGTTLLPAMNSLLPNAAITLTAGVHPPPSQLVTYQYSTTPGLFGKLTDGTNAGHVNNFSSSSATVTYTANATGGGTDTVTVTPQLVVTGQPNTPLTPASATIAVNVAPTPAPVPSNFTTTLSLTPNECVQFGSNTGQGSYLTTTQVYTALVGTPAPAGTSYLYGWVIYGTTMSGFTVAVQPPLVNTGSVGGASLGFADSTSAATSATVSSPYYPIGGSEYGTTDNVTAGLFLSTSQGIEAVLQPNGYQVEAQAQLAGGQSTCPPSDSSQRRRNLPVAPNRIR